jgi:hypothetical protein
MYVLTGNATYLNAMLNAWSLLREWWIMVSKGWGASCVPLLIASLSPRAAAPFCPQPGGSITLNEGNYYPPGSYYIGNVGTHISAMLGHGHRHHHDVSGHAHSHAHRRHLRSDAPAAAGSALKPAASAKLAPASSSDPYFHAPCMFQPGQSVR